MRVEIPKKREQDNEDSKNYLIIWEESEEKFPFALFLSDILFNCEYDKINKIITYFLIDFHMREVLEW